MFIINLKLIFKIIFNPVESAKEFNINLYNKKFMEVILLVFIITGEVIYYLNGRLDYKTLIIFIGLQLIFGIRYIIPLVAKIDRYFINLFLKEKIHEQQYYNIILPYLSAGSLFGVIAITINSYVNINYVYELVIILVILIQIFYRYIIIKYIYKNQIQINGWLIFTLCIILVNIYIRIFGVPMPNKIDQDTIRYEVYYINMKIYNLAVDLAENEVSIDMNTHKKCLSILKSRESDNSSYYYYNIKDMTLSEEALEYGIDELYETANEINVLRKKNTTIPERLWNIYNNYKKRTSRILNESNIEPKGDKEPDGWNKPIYLEP